MPIKHKISNTALRIIARLQEAGYKAYLVGGAVRDLLLGLAPKDYDIATSATPEQIKAVFGRSSRIIGRRFRLVHVYADRMIFEVSTFRREPSLEERKGRGIRRPQDSGEEAGESALMVWRDNVFGTWEEDAMRRDFTVNAIYYDPLNAEHECTDFVDGMKDIEAKVVRTIGEPAVRLEEDPVRMLRALKLVGQYGFRLEDSLRDAIKSGTSQITLSSKARLLEELYKILKKPYCHPTFAACQDLGLLSHLLPQLSDDWESETGQFAQLLLKTRDNYLARGEVFASRVTALGVILLPFAAREFQAHANGFLWKNFTGVDKQLHSLIKGFFAPPAALNCPPRYMVAKIRDVLLLQPKLLQNIGRRRVLRHPEYSWARDLFSICVYALKMDGGKDLLDPWPPGPSRRGSQRQSQGQPGRRRPR